MKGDLATAKNETSRFDCLAVWPNGSGSIFCCYNLFHSDNFAGKSKPLRVFILDNYDSFTYNLVHYCREFAREVRVVQNDKADSSEALAFDKVILSPGPGLPSESGNLMPFLEEINDKIPLLGVCLGLQAITELYGGRLLNLPEVLHGVSTECQVLTPDVLFPFPEHHFQAGHYHSWVADAGHLPECLEVTSVNEQGLIMSLRHRTLPVRAVQFHPESILTPHGKEMLASWLQNG